VKKRRRLVHPDAAPVAPKKTYTDGIDFKRLLRPKEPVPEKVLTVPVNPDGSLRFMDVGEFQALGNALAGIPNPEAFWDMLRDGVTQGFFENMVCPERVRLKYREGWTQTRFKGAMKFGDVIHNALDVAYTTYRDTRNPTLAVVSTQGTLDADEFITRQALKEEGGLSQVEEELEEIYGTAAILLHHYWKAWEGDFNGSMQWETLEQTFSVPYEFTSEKYGRVVIPIRGKIDATYRVKNGRLWVLDHKSKSQINEGSISDRLPYDLQTMLYAWAVWKLTGEKPAGVLYNVMRRPQLRRKQSENLSQFLERVNGDVEKRREFYFVRFEAPIMPKGLEAFEKELDSLVRLAHAWYRGAFHYRFSPACDTKYGACEFLPVCGRADFSRLHKRDVPFPELIQVEVD
jgi:hypothetical protein